MGYLFTIKFSSVVEEIRKYIKKSIDTDKCNGYVWYKDNGFHWYDNEDGYVSWYDCERDILKISEKFPVVLITVYKEHESNSFTDYYDCKAYDNTDLTVQYFKNGKCTEEKPAKITVTFEEFTDEKLLS
jgi:hypothetical protein